MRIFNGTDAQISLPLGTIRLEIPGKVASKDFAPNPDFLSLLVTAYSEKDIALIVSGPFELSMCSTLPPVAPLLVQTLEEAIERFSPKEELKKENESQPEPEKKEYSPIKEEQPVVLVEDEPVEEEIEDEEPVEEVVTPTAEEETPVVDNNISRKKKGKKNRK